MERHDRARCFGGGGVEVKGIVVYVGVEVEDIVVDAAFVHFEVLDRKKQRKR